MGKERFTSSTSTIVSHEAPKERTEQAPKQDGSPNDAGKLHNELREKYFGSSGKGTEQAPKQDEAGKLHKEMAEKHLGSSGNGTEEALKQDEAGKLLKELADLRPGKGTEQVELPQNKTSEAANPNGTNKGLASILRNLVTAIGGHHVGVFGCNNGAQGTRCNIEGNNIVSKDSHHAGIFECGNENKKPNYFDISHLIIVCLVLLCFAMYKY